jgi:hypothetical protein
MPHVPFCTWVFLLEDTPSDLKYYLSFVGKTTFLFAAATSIFASDEWNLNYDFIAAPGFGRKT